MEPVVVTECSTSFNTPINVITARQTPVIVSMETVTHELTYGKQNIVKV